MQTVSLYKLLPVEHIEVTWIFGETLKMNSVCLVHCVDCFLWAPYLFPSFFFYRNPVLALICSVLHPYNDLPFHVTSKLLISKFNVYFYNHGCSNQH